MRHSTGIIEWVVRGGSIGLTAGLIELVIVAWPALTPQSPWPGMFHSSPHWLWLKPLAGAALGTGIAVSGGLVQRTFPRHVKPRWVLWLVTSVLMVAALFPFWPRIRLESLALLAAGAAVPTSGWLSRPDDLLRGRVVRTASAIVVAILILTGAALTWVPILRERQAYAGWRPAPQGSPNIVLVVLDTVRLDAIANLPNLERLGSGGVQFDQAFATSSWTLETHASLFTGRYPQHVFARGETPLNFESPLPPEMPTIAEVLRDNGYATGGFVANTIYASREHGLDRGFLHYDDYPLTTEDLIASSALSNKVLQELEQMRRRPRVIGRRNAEQVTEAFLRWFDRQAGQPVFAFLNYFDAHDPYLPPAEFRSPGIPDNPRINPLRLYTPGEVASLKKAYLDCVRYLDYAVGRLAEALIERGVLDSTVLVITSDHGEHFGEHDLMTHGNSLYRSTVQVPLMIRYPRIIPPATRVAAPVTLRDVPATLLELVGVSGASLPGSSLSAYWNSKTRQVRTSPVISTLVIGREPHQWAPRQWPVSRGSMRSIVMDDLHYIRSGDGAEELYELVDINERRDLARVPERAQALARLRSALAEVERRPESR